MQYLIVLTAFLIVHSTITDPDKFDEYVQEVTPLVEAYGGQYLFGGMLAEVLEGQHNQERTVVFEFPDVESVRSWYHSDSYRKIRQLRENAGSFDFLVVDEFD